MAEYQLQYTGAKIQGLLEALDKNKSKWDSVTSLKQDVDALKNSAPKSLWKGNWTEGEGSVTVRGINDYYVMAVVFNDSFSVVCFKDDVNINGGGSWVDEDGNYCTSYVRLTTSGDAVSIKNITHALLTCPIELLSRSKPELPITEIIGIV